MPVLRWVLALSNPRPGIFGVPVGSLDLPHSDIFGGADRSVINVPIVSYVLVADDRITVVDTGNSPEALKDPVAAWGPVGKRLTPHASSDMPLCTGLEKLGISPGDVTDVVQTHLHLDHTGELRQFTGAKVWVQRLELAAAMHPHRYYSMPYITGDIDPSVIAYEEVDGDTRISDDIHVLLTPGHTPGHQSVMLKSPGKRSAGRSDWYVVVGDAFYSRKQVDGRRYGGSMWDAEQWWFSRSRLVMLEQAFGATLLVPHDETQQEDDVNPWQVDVSNTVGE